MKIKEEHYDQLKNRIDAYLDKYPEINCKDALENTKLRWSIYWKTGGFSNAQEYHYLDDIIESLPK